MKAVEGNGAEVVTAVHEAYIAALKETTERIEKAIEKIALDEQRCRDEQSRRAANIYAKLEAHEKWHLDKVNSYVEKAEARSWQARAWVIGPTVTILIGLVVQKLIG